MELKEKDLKVFVDAVTHYFSQSTRSPALIRAAYLADSSVPQFQYTGLISISGHFCGCVHFSAPEKMVRCLLLEWGEPDASKPNLLEAVGDIANTIAGNARKHFGKELEISVPITLFGATDEIKAAVRVRPFVISLEWCNSQATVVVDLEPAKLEAIA